MLTPPRPQTVPRLLLLTTEHLVLADPKAAQPKTVLSLGDIRSVSVTRFSDGFLALHLKEVHGEGHPWGLGGSLVGLTPPAPHRPPRGEPRATSCLSATTSSSSSPACTRPLWTPLPRPYPCTSPTSTGGVGGWSYQGWGLQGGARLAGVDLAGWGRVVSGVELTRVG